MTWSEVAIPIVSITFLFGGITIVLVWIMKIAQAKVQASASVEHTMMVRSLAEEATAAQRTTANELTEVRLAMVDIRERLAAIERMMAEVG
jgi:hypothetical protein